MTETLPGVWIAALSVVPAWALAYGESQPIVFVTAGVIALALLMRASVARMAPDAARGYVFRRLCSLRYVVPALTLPVLEGRLIAWAGWPGFGAALAVQLGLCLHYHRCWRGPGALRRACLPALCGGLHCALECLALSGPEIDLGGRVLYAEQNHLQRITLLEYPGSIELFIDGELQFDSADEALYHAGLLESVLTLLPRRARVLVMGGGDGLATRDLLRGADVAQVTVVDWDRHLTALFRREPDLRALNQDALHDPRVRLLHRDIRDVLSQHSGAYDLVLGDLTDAGPGAQVYSVAFYQALRKQLRPQGVIVTHASSRDGSSSSAISLALEAAGFRTQSYARRVPSFESITYVMGTPPA